MNTHAWVRDEVSSGHVSKAEWTVSVAIALDILCSIFRNHPFPLQELGGRRGTTISASGAAVLAAFPCPRVMLPPLALAQRGLADKLRFRHGLTRGGDKVALAY